MSRSRDASFMRGAIAKAKEGIRQGQSPFGACIVKGARVLACSHNHVWKNTDITAHAEIVAIRQACRKLKTIDLSGCVIYATCEPCPMCFAACHWANITKIVYGARIADAKKIGFDELPIANAKMKRLGGLGVFLVEDFLRAECLELFTLWLRQSNRCTY